ncbi:MAG: Rho termination factor N-terminal domain-containing protein [Clostridia bacterium]|nr:Rho termination factor N-terminal domain-containing protein [Clostridia bacterium]
MKRVKLIGPGLKLQKSWHWIGEEVQISDEEYEKNKKYLEVLEDNGEETLPGTIIPTNPDESEKENSDLDDESNGNDNEEDEELEILRNKAKELGIANAGRMKKETLIEKIAEKEAENGANEEDTEE